MLWWWISGAFGVMIYVALLTIFGLGCIQKSQWVWFVLGFVFPLFWIIGATRPPTSNAQPI